MMAFRIIGITFALAGAVLAYDHKNPNARSAISGQAFGSGGNGISGGSGAKFVSVGKPQTPTQNKSVVTLLMETYFAQENKRNGYGQDGLGALRARTIAQSEGRNEIDVGDIARQMEDAMNMANQMGVQTGPTQLDNFMSIHGSK